MINLTLISLAVGLPAPGGFISIYKALIVVACLALWAAFGQWVNTDTQYARMSRNLWNGVILSAGIIAFAAWLLMPLPGWLFFLGWAIWFLIAGGAGATYVVYRNGIVPPHRRVFTKTHIIAKIGAANLKRKKTKPYEKVKLEDARGRTVDAPEDEDEILAYAAAQDLIFDALWRRATHVDLAIAGEKTRLTYRIDGIIAERKDLLDHDRAEMALRFLKKIAGLDVEERRRPQQGKAAAEFAGSTTTNAQIDVKSSGSTMGERLQLGVVSDQSQFRLSDLGFAQPRLDQLMQVVKELGGLVICSGIKQSGLTTTLYAILRNHDVFMRNIHTLESRPIIYDLENITQHKHDAVSSDVSYARRLQTILRREPDIVMADDFSTEDTARLVAKAAAKGRKIYVQVHAKDALDALDKVLQLVDKPDDLAQSLLAITNQRLVRKLCTACREAYKPDLKLLKKVNLPADKIEHFYRPPSKQLVDKKGNPIICTECQGTGYVGRTGVFEFLLVDDNIRKLIKAKADIAAIKAQARKNKTLYLQEEGLLKVMEGITSMNEIIRGLRDNSEG